MICRDRGKNTPVYLANATATAAIAPVWITKQRPSVKETAEWTERLRRYTYCPPACGIMAASSGHS
jgi:hypothetical protein